MKFIALKTNDGQKTGKIAFYCKLLHVSRQGFYKYLKAQTHPWKYQDVADAARKAGVPFQQVWEAALSAAREG